MKSEWDWRLGGSVRQLSYPVLTWGAGQAFGCLKTCQRSYRLARLSNSLPAIRQTAICFLDMAIQRTHNPVD